MKSLRTVLVAVAVAVVVVTIGAIAAPPAHASSGYMVVTTNTTLTEDHHGEILVRGNNITLDCAGHHVVGPGFAAVNLDSVSGTTVKNCDVSGFKTGFFVWSSPNNTFLDNKSSDNESSGFTLATSPNNTGNVLVGNESSRNGWWGFAIHDNSAETTLKLNTSRSNGFNGYFVGLGSDRTQLIQNVAEGDGFDIDSDANLVSGNRATSAAGNGFLIFQANGNTFAGNVASGSADNGFLSISTSNTFRGNIALNNHQHGFVFTRGATSNRLIGNTASGNTDGFRFEDGSSTNQLSENTASGNSVHGFGFYAVEGIGSSHDEAAGNSGFGFFLLTTTTSTFVHDIAHDNDNGFVLDGSNNNTLAKDVANHNRGFGFVLYNGSSANRVDQSVAHGNPSADAADFGLPGANFWVRNSFGTTLLP